MKPPSYNDNVFINCPFDSDYKPLFTALSPMEHYGSLDDLSEIPLRKIRQTLHWLICLCFLERLILFSNL